MREYQLYYAEDDLDDLHIFREALEAHPEVRVTHFANGRLLLDVLEAAPEERFPCLIVLDLNMPVLTGRDTLVQLRTNPRYTGIPVLLFTTSNSEIDKKFARQWNVELITKPIIFKEMEQLALDMVHLCNGKPAKART
ncbi:MAG: response regulator [Chitinophagaceae bacterium]|nr:MAG: response regulator [Chitinophagaceae bacterium]